jgi:hypothetical protein
MTDEDSVNMSLCRAAEVGTVGNGQLSGLKKEPSLQRGLNQMPSTTQKRRDKASKWFSSLQHTITPGRYRSSAMPRAVCLAKIMIENCHCSQWSRIKLPLSTNG